MQLEGTWDFLKKKDFLSAKLLSENFCLVAKGWDREAHNQFHFLRHWKVVGKSSILWTVIVENEDHALWYLFLQENVSPVKNSADLTFSRRQRQYDFGLLAWRQQWILMQYWYDTTLAVVVNIPSQETHDIMTMTHGVFFLLTVSIIVLLFIEMSSTTLAFL